MFDVFQRDTESIIEKKNIFDIPATGITHISIWGVKIHTNLEIEIYKLIHSPTSSSIGYKMGRDTNYKSEKPDTPYGYLGQEEELLYRSMIHARGKGTSEFKAIPVKEEKTDNEKWRNELDYFNKVKSELFKNEKLKDRYVAIKDNRIISVATNNL